jgi:hypothetical protein
MGAMTYVRHKVYADQLERDPETGKLRIVQAGYHKLWLWNMQLQLAAKVGLTDWMDVRLRFPLRVVSVVAGFENNQGEMLPGYDSIHHRTETLVGISDPSLHVGFRPLSFSSKQPWMLEFSVGLSFPLGRTEPDPYEAGRLGKEHQHVLFGSGTFDPVGSVTFGYVGRFFQVFADMMVRGGLYENAHRFQRGLQLQGSLAVESAFGLRHWGFQLQTSLIVQRPDLWHGIPDIEAGGDMLTLLVGAVVFWRPTVHLQMSLRLNVPFQLVVTEGEVFQPISIGIGATYQFRLFQS